MPPGSTEKSPSLTAISAPDDISNQIFGVFSFFFAFFKHAMILLPWKDSSSYPFLINPKGSFLEDTKEHFWTVLPSWPCGS